MKNEKNTPFCDGGKDPQQRIIKMNLSETTAAWLDRTKKLNNAKKATVTPEELIQMRIRKYQDRLVYDPPDWFFLGLRISSIRPTKPLLDGWTFGWHAWNKGFTLAYRTPVLKSETKVLFAEDLSGSIVPYKVTVTEKPTFWQRRFPKHFTFTGAKLCGKWRFTRAYDPFMEASLAATPILSAQEWNDLGKEGIEILGKNGIKSGTSC